MANNPTFEQTLRTPIKANFNQQLLSAYTQGLVLPAIILTFWNNSVLASLLALTLPSLLIPFWEVIIGAGRAFLWGLALSPADLGFGSKIILYLPTLLLEGQGYILAMLAVYVLWRNFFRPDRGQGYKLGLKQTGLLYLDVAGLLAIAATYEAVAAASIRACWTV